MPELLIYKYDASVSEPGLSKAALYAKFQKFDLVVWEPDGFAWGEQELHNPVFRIIKWPALPVAVCQQLMGYMVATWTPLQPQTNYLLLRQSFFNSGNVDISTAFPAFTAWWQDDTRAAPTFTINNATLTSKVANYITVKTAPSFP